MQIVLKQFREEYLTSTQKAVQFWRTFPRGAVRKNFILRGHVHLAPPPGINGHMSKNFRIQISVLILVNYALFPFNKSLHFLSFKIFFWLLSPIKKNIFFADKGFALTPLPLQRKCPLRVYFFVDNQRCHRRNTGQNIYCTNYIISSMYIYSSKE